MSRHPLHPELRTVRYMSNVTVGPRNFRRIRRMIRVVARAIQVNAAVVTVDENVSVRVFRPTGPCRERPALLWIHGGGLVLGTAAMDDRQCRRIAEQLGVVVASVEYRLAPEHPFPTPLEDCYTALRWLAVQPDVDTERIAIGGASAGGGLAAALTLMAHEREEIHPVFQLLVYPMLDDRTTTRDDIDPHRIVGWDQDSNRFGWRSYLQSCWDGEVPHLAAPARCEDLAGLPAAWIGVGTMDLFHDESVNYAERLRAAGVSCTLRTVPGAPHAFDLYLPWVPISRSFRRTQMAVLADALGVHQRTESSR